MGLRAQQDIANKSHTLTNKLLETLVNKVHESWLVDQQRQNISLKRNTPLGGERPPLVQVDVELNWLRMIDLEKLYSETSNMGKVQRMIHLALKKGPKVSKFIHPYPVFVKRFEYPQGFKIPNLSLFAGGIIIVFIGTCGQITAQCGDVNNDYYKLRLFNF